MRLGEVATEVKGYGRERKFGPMPPGSAQIHTEVDKKTQSHRVLRFSLFPELWDSLGPSLTTVEKVDLGIWTDLGSDLC